MFSEMLEINNIEGSFATASNAYKIYGRDHDKDIFESVIDGLIIEKYADQDVKEYIKNLPSSKKRIATLSLIGDDNLLWSKINVILNEEKSGYQRLKSVYTLLKEYVKIADVERKKHGEILTPFAELAEPMVKLVEKYDPEFWKNKNHKVLDSSAGYGTFLILAAYKFMVGLKDDIKDEEERFKWIVENCLYYGELQAKSVFSWLVAIDPHNEYKTNIYWGSFLSKEFDEHAKNVWGVDKWNLIMQNPPYQKLKETDKNKDSKNPKTQPLWHLFVKKSLSLLKKGGYMVMVHPGGWRDLDGVFKETQNLLKENKILELHMFPFKSGLEIFKAKTNFDYYILKNEKNDQFITEIHCENGTIERLNLLDLNYIPGENISLIQNIFSKNNRVNLIHSYSAYEPRKNFISKEKNDINKYPIVYMVSYKNIPTFIYSSRNDRGHFGIPKVIWASGSSGVIIDYKGEYGLTPFSAAISDEPENLENIKKALESEKFIKEVMLFKNGLGHKYNNKVISMLKKDFWKEFI
jgi:hypothetical protein